MSNDMETSSSSEESSSDSDEEQKPVPKIAEKKPPVEKANVASGSSSEHEESGSEDSELQDSKSDAAKTKLAKPPPSRSNRANGVKKVESEKNGKGEAHRVVNSNSVTAAEAVETAPARIGDPKVAASRVEVVVGDKKKSRPSRARAESTKVTLGDKKRPNSASQETVKVKSASRSADNPPTMISSDALGLWDVGSPGVAYGKLLPEVKDTPLKLRKPLLELKKRYGELYREQINVAVSRVKSILQQCEVERNLSLLQYETEEFLARLPFK